MIANAKAPPLALTAELTHRCPMQCLYCSNPISLMDKEKELTTRQWSDVFAAAAALGVLQVHLSGGEPLLRSDLAELLRICGQLHLYTNLITSGVGLSEKRLHDLIAAGLKRVQLSLQASEATVAKQIAGVDVFEQKLSVLRLLVSNGIYVTANVVINRFNIGRIEDIVSMCITGGARRIELANAQYYGWALENRLALLPTRTQVQDALEKIAAIRKTVPASVELIWILPDYFEDFPKPCMGGWAKQQLTVSPDGTAYPCPAASAIEHIDYPNVNQSTLEWIWNQSPAFNLFRGEKWMNEPCRTCEMKDVDFGGCRCQAYLLTGDAASADPVCKKSDWRKNVDDIVNGARAETGRLKYRV